MHLLRSVYVVPAIKRKYPQLSTEELDDILATIEELERRYSTDFFIQKTTLQNVLRLTSMKYIAIENVIEAIISGKEPANQRKFNWAKKNLIIVSARLDQLEKIQSQYPDYPITHLSPEEETAKAMEICESEFGKSIIAAGGIVGDLIYSDLSTIYYLFPTKKKKPMKYSAVIEAFKPGFNDFDYEVITASARDTAKLLKIRMTDPLNIDIFFTYLIRTTNMAIKAIEKQNLKINVERDSIESRTLTILKATHDMIVHDKDLLLKKYEEKGITGRDVLVEITKNSIDVQKVITSPLVNTMGDFLVAASAFDLE